MQMGKAKGPPPGSENQNYSPMLSRLPSVNSGQDVDRMKDL